MELKTLFDLSYGLNRIPMSHCVPKELRQEAIKYIRFFEEENKKQEKILEKITYEMNRLSIFGEIGKNNSMITFIKMFFNIPDSDLNTEKPPNQGLRNE